MYQPLVTWGLPSNPLTSSNVSVISGKPVQPNQLRCLQYDSDKGCPIHTDLLIWVAGSGDLELVRLLHSRGVGLWAGAYEEQALYPTVHRCSWQSPTTVGVAFLGNIKKDDLRQQEVIAIPRKPQDVAEVWRVLQYRWAMGAPLTPAMEEVFMAKRAATRSTLLSLKVADRLSRKEGISSQERAA
jgi:hypothetical protein